MQLHIQRPDDGNGYQQDIKIADHVDGARSVWADFRIDAMTGGEDIPQFPRGITVEDLQEQHGDIGADNSHDAAME